MALVPSVSTQSMPARSRSMTSVSTSRSSVTSSTSVTAISGRTTLGSSATSSARPASAARILSGSTATQLNPPDSSCTTSWACPIVFDTAVRRVRTRSPRSLRAMFARSCRWFSASGSQHTAAPKRCVTRAATVDEPILAPTSTKRRPWIARVPISALTAVTARLSVLNSGRARLRKSDLPMCRSAVETTNLPAFVSTPTYLA